jgi:hypothetical protein
MYRWSERAPVIHACKIVRKKSIRLIIRYGIFVHVLIRLKDKDQVTDSAAGLSGPR